MSNTICIVGTIATDPRRNEPADGRVAFCTFRVASNERRYDREQGAWVDGETTWLTINAFRSLADHAHASFAKGDRVVVSGRLRVRPWERDGRSGTAVEVEADALGHDLRWGTTRFTKRSGASDPTAAERSAGAHPARGAERSAAPEAAPAEDAPGTGHGAPNGFGAADDGGSDPWGVGGSETHQSDPEREPRAA